MKNVLIAICAVLFLLVGCIHKENHAFILENPTVNLTEGYEVADFTLPGYLCSTEMRYTTKDGELHTIKGSKWALPLDRLLRATANDSLRILPKSSLNAKHSFRIDRICLTNKTTLLFTGEVSIRDDANVHKPQTIPFRSEVKVTSPLDSKQYWNAMNRVLGELLQKEL